MSKEQSTINIVEHEGSEPFTISSPALDSSDQPVQRESSAAELNYRHTNGRENTENYKVANEIPDKELKQLTNSGIDGAVEAVRMERTSMKRRTGSFKEENGLSKGIVLNATEFVHPPKPQWSSENDVGDKAKDEDLALKNRKSQSSEKTDSPSEKKDSEMTLLRKIAFAFSFLPSIMFVLCFAIILPCEEPHQPEPCVKEAWSLSLNHTMLAAGPGVTHAVLVGLFGDDKAGRILSLDSDNGEELWSKFLKSKPLYIDCKDYDVNGDGLSDCLITDRLGSLYAVNSSDGYVFWNYTGGSVITQPILLSDCDGDDVREVAIVDSYNTIQILANGKKLKTLRIEGCMITAGQFMSAWVQDTETHLVFSCQSVNGSSKLKLMKQDTWCSKQPKPGQETLGTELLDGFRDKINLQGASYLSFQDNFVVWAEHLIICFGIDATEKWRAQNFNHSQQRFLVYGNFSLGEHITLISYEASNGVLITLLNIVDGNETLTSSSRHPELKTVISVPGKNQDYLLMLFESLQGTEIHADVSPKPEVLFDPSSFLTNKTIEQSITIFKIEKLLQKIVLFQFERKDTGGFVLKKDLFSEIYEILRETDEDTAELTAFVEGDQLMMFLGKTVFKVFESDIGYNTFLKKLKVENWDASSAYCASTK